MENGGGSGSRKGGKHHEIPAHHSAEEYLDAYIEAADVADESRNPLFRSLDRRRQLTARRLSRGEALAMIKRRARRDELPAAICCHTFRDTGITAYLIMVGRLRTTSHITSLLDGGTLWER